MDIGWFRTSGTGSPEALSPGVPQNIHRKQTENEDAQHLFPGFLNRKISTRPQDDMKKERQKHSPDPVFANVGITKSKRMFFKEKTRIRNIEKRSLFRMLDKECVLPSRLHALESLLQTYLPVFLPPTLDHVKNFSNSNHENQYFNKIT